jgi:hypothetical protein
MQSRLLLCIPALATILASAACSGDPGPDAFCAEAPNHSDLPWLQENVFTPSCSHFSACHMGRASDAAHLSLEPGKSQRQLVNIDSDLFGPDGTEQHGDWVRVVPGDPDHSYMMVVIGDLEGPLTDCTSDYATCMEHHVGSMPYNSPLLCQEKRDAIRRWIADGAQDPDAVDAGPPPPDAAPADAAPPDAGPPDAAL